MHNGLFDQIRHTCALVSEQSAQIKIHCSIINDYLRKLPLHEALNPVMDKTNHYYSDPETTLAYFITLNAINFGSGYFNHFTKDEGKTGYYTIASSLKQKFEQTGAFSASQLTETTPENCRQLFGQSADNEPVNELMLLFSKALNDLGNFLANKFDGSFSNLILAADRSCEKLVQILCEMPMYNDSHMYKGKKVFFHTRAQTTASDLHIAFGGQGFGRFDDIDKMTVFADNLIPHVLRHDGVLSYSSELENKITNLEEIPSGSEEEIEIRAATIHSVELLREALDRLGISVTSKGLDHLFWNRGQQQNYRSLPRHITKSIFY